MTDPTPKQTTISGIDVMRGVGAERAKPFWADAWHRVVIRRGAQLGLVWIAIIGFFAIFAPVLANGLPLWSSELDANGVVLASSSPLLQSLTATDVLLLIGGILAPLLYVLPLSINKQHRTGLICAAAFLGGMTVVLVAVLRYTLVGEAATESSQSAWFPWAVSLGAGLGVAIVTGWLPTFGRAWARIAFALVIALSSGAICADRWSAPVLNPERFVRGQEEGTLDNTYTIVPWSPTQSRAVYYSKPPAQTAADAYRAVADSRIRDGIAFYARAIAFNIKADPAQGLPLTPIMRGELVTLLLGHSATSADALAAGGVAPEQVKRFVSMASGLAAYTAAVHAGEQENARAAATSIGEVASTLEATGRNARITIDDAGAELRSRVPERIKFVQEANVVAETSYGRRDFLLGTDPIGRDVLSQMLHACRLSISIGLVSTGISVLLGIVIGSLMGYFGGWVDLVLSRIVEIFMAVPVLFLLIVAASVLPRNTYVMMAIIGCVTWTGSARFIRAEFLKLRNQDFVQSCRAVGLPLHSILFKHMLPNGVTPVLVQASFGVAAAIIAEATLSYLGLGPYGQSSWGKLLSLTTGETGVFLWWMAVFPGVAIFLTVLAYNVLGENFRDAIDPKMRKAAH